MDFSSPPTPIRIYRNPEQQMRNGHVLSEDVMNRMRTLTVKRQEGSVLIFDFKFDFLSQNSSLLPGQRFQTMEGTTLQPISNVL